MDCHKALFSTLEWAIKLFFRGNWNGSTLTVCCSKVWCLETASKKNIEDYDDDDDDDDDAADDDDDDDDDAFRQLSSNEIVSRLRIVIPTFQTIFLGGGFK